MPKTAIFTALLAATAEWAVAQPAPRAPSHATLEFGVQRRYIPRTFRDTYGIELDTDFGRDALYARAALASFLSVELNGFARHIGATDRFPQRDYVTVTIGGSLTVTPLATAGTAIDLGLEGFETANLDQSPTRYDKRTQGLRLTLRGRRRLHLGPLTPVVWAGPCYAADWLTQYPGTDPPSRSHSLHNIGALAGGAILLARRVRLSGELAHLDFWQWQTGVGVVF